MTTVRLIAPSGYPNDPAIAERGVAFLQAQGCTIVNRECLSRQHQRFAGEDDARLADLHQIATSSGQEIAMAIRGGYGLTRLLDRVDFAAIHQRARATDAIIVGHSDFTAFSLAYLAATGGVTFAGPHLCSDFALPEVDAYMAEHFWGILRNPNYALRVDVPQATARPGHASRMAGTLWGGNLAMLCSLVGTPYLPRIDGGILFVEDINEHPYRVERMLLQLQQAGVLERQQALVLGDFSGYRTTPYDAGYDFGPMCDYLAARLPIPVLTGLPFGHCPTKATLPIGAQAELDIDATGFTLHLGGYPTLRG
ncbi:muramoyltetrapeptide carboxypeptidase [Ralstonia insidiosa]|uniref:Muramoyltetrapeptide carboxypeptidase n=1 Tax=Ralstonia insidiosa TaxID=190721 RepID=A0A191ZWL8_9RALS|nr:muramoyltetrapeptide carboxypeptidase [Ralstonia insidiosa]ANJ72483.1 muramoyltetrapeptide carboxypeptidase [Ralstonia insidiosa]KAB0473029.1 muramoyltetrapeptide carboxypeptidase [Ralstonia insidiosa]MBY4911897.1 muramoyltetrapeptide carboxypeptidase [Ralstonia insidiosa]